MQLCSLESACDRFHHDNPGVGYFLIHEEEGEGGGAISLHPLKEFNTIHLKKGKVYRSAVISCNKSVEYEKIPIMKVSAMYM